MTAKKSKGGAKNPGKRTREGITAKQRLFVEFYTGVSESNATDAARRAGYTGADDTVRAAGSENLSKPHIIAAIREATKEVRSKAIADRRERQEALTQIIREQSEREVKFTVTGIPVFLPDDDKPYRIPHSPSVRVSAIKTLGEMQGDFVQNFDVKVHSVTSDMLQRMEKELSPGAYAEVVSLYTRRSKELKGSR